jgi:hypothetical protein
MNNEGQRRAAFLTPTRSLKQKTEEERSLGYQMLRKQKNQRKKGERKEENSKKELCRKLKQTRSSVLLLNTIFVFIVIY